MTAPAGVWGLLAGFSTADGVIRAAKAVREAGYTDIEAYAPFPVEGLAPAIGHRKSALPLIILVGGVTGALTGFFLQYFAWVIDYPMNVGGKPDNSWPAWIPVTFELAVLFASLTTVFGVLGLNGLPRPHHPLFGVPEFRYATSDRFFVSIAATDPKFDGSSTRAFLESLSPDAVLEVPA